MEEKIFFNSKNKKIQIELNRENPFMKITRLEIPNVPKDSININMLIPNFQIKCNVKKENGDTKSDNITSSTRLIGPNTKEAKFGINHILSNNSENVSIELEYEYTSGVDVDVVVYYTLFDMSVDLQNPFDNFSKHINLSDNTKILFSAPFGHGKTTFLRYFFEEKSRDYEVFRLFPVNYSVSHNEDIFKYIKAEVLFQLLSKNVDFENEKFSYMETAPYFFKTNLEGILSSFLELLPAIGKSASDIYKQFYGMAVKYLNYHDKVQKNEEKEAVEFIKELYEKEGSIYEDNFYTQLIKQLLIKLKENTGKKNVLIIDDTDRMDPEHVFRIFNVFAAHFDSHDFLFNSNKFGFDKIIIVCDYRNLQRLFHHKYGKDANYEGYLGKYYSRQPYFYNNRNSLEVLTNRLAIYENRPLNNIIFRFLVFILNDLISIGEISLRDVLKLLKFDFFNTINKQMNILSSDFKFPNSFFVYFNIFSFLESIFDIDSIIEKLKKCVVEAPSRNVKYNVFTSFALIPLSKGKIAEGSFNIQHDGRSVTFEIKRQNDVSINYEYLEANAIRYMEGTGNVEFTKKDFYKYLLDNAKIYKELENNHIKI